MTEKVPAFLHSGETVLTKELLDLLATPPKAPKRCGTTDWLATLSPEIQAGVVAALADQRWKTTDLHARLRDHFGYPLQYNSLHRHRSGSCCG